MAKTMESCGKVVAMAKTSCSALALVALSYGAQLSPSREHRWDTGVEQTWILPALSFTAPDVLARAAQVLRNTEHLHFVRAVFVPNAGTLSLLAKSGTDGTYESWLAQYADVSDTSPEIAELIRIGSDAIFRMRSSDGTLVRKVLRGTDPLTVINRGRRFDILHIAVRYSGAEQRQCGMNVYLKGTPARELSRNGELLREFSHRLRRNDVDLFIREDGWFIEDSEYPVANPLADLPRAPSRSQYRQVVGVACGSLQGKINCARFQAR